MSRTAAAIAAVAVATGLIVGVVIASSGGGGGSTDPVTTPDLTVPGGSGSTGLSSPRQRKSKGTTGQSGTTGSGGTQQPTAPAPDQSGGAGTPQAPQDTPNNNTTPPAGNPASRFENFCKQNPTACGD